MWMFPYRMKKAEWRSFSDQSVKRMPYFDCLRIAATFAVMVLHLASQNWYAVEAGTYEWKVFNLYDALVRWAVPVFVMISGSLFLSGARSLERIFKKNVRRILTAFIFWSAIYAFANLALGRSGLKNALREFVEGPPHMWFLFMIAGLYILVPLLQKIVEDDRMAGYFVLLSLVFTFAAPYAITIMALYSEKLAEIAGGLLKSVGFNFTLGYVGYFVYGYYFGHIDIKGKKKWAIYLFGILGAVVTLFASAIFPVSAKSASVVFHDNMTLNVMFISIALFILAKNNINLNNASPKTVKTLGKLSDYSFGAYLVHALVITLLNHNPLFKLNTMQFKLNIVNMEEAALNPLISVPGIAVIVFVISYIISGILHCIPGLKRYVV